MRKYKALIKSKMLRWLFCVDDTLLDEIQQESELRDDIRDAMCQHTEGTGTAAITNCLKEIYNETGHDMFTANRTVEMVYADSSSPVELDAKLGELGLTDNYGLAPRDKVVVVPKFAAAMVLCLRAKFGNLNLTEANRLLIEREYLRVCRESTVRNCDIVVHQQCVMNAFFTEGVHEELCTVRARLPRWLREAFGSVPKVQPCVC